MSAGDNGANSTAIKGGAFSLFTPKRKSAGLKTPVTRVQAISDNKLAPLFARSVSNPASSRFHDLCQEVFLTNRLTTAQAVLTQEKDFENVSCNEQSMYCDLKKESNANPIENQSKDWLCEMQSSIHPPQRLLTSDGEDVFVKRELSLLKTAVPKNNIGENRTRVHTSSCCSSCSGTDSVPTQSRCSICDGCSSSVCGSQYSQFSPELNETKHQKWNSNVEDIEERLLMHLPEGDLIQYDTLSHMAHSEEPSDLLHTMDGRKNSCPISKEHLIFLLLQILLSKYRYLMDDVSVQKKLSVSQKKTIACLIQAVLMLVNKVNATEMSWKMIQKEIITLKRERSVHQRQQRRMLMCMCVVLAINILNTSAMKRRLGSLVRFFGVVETVKKINRTRRMVANNWRNIPSLLTEFWRLFIFRSQLRLKKPC